METVVAVCVCVCVCVPVDVGPARGLVHLHHTHPLTNVSRRCKPTGPHDSDLGPMTRSVRCVFQVWHAAISLLFVSPGQNLRGLEGPGRAWQIYTERVVDQGR